jgi:RES domain-containing protein
LTPQQATEQKIQRAFGKATGYAGICFRNVLQLYANQDDILSPVGSIIAGGRYNFIRTFGVIYLSHEVSGCFAETLKTAGDQSFLLAENLPRTIVSVRIELSRVLNLADSRVRRSVGVALSVLKAPGWEKIQEEQKIEAPTQLIGKYAYDAGFEAIQVPSAACNGLNLDVFPDNLLDSSKVTVVNEIRLLEHRTVIRKI